MDVISGMIYGLFDPRTTTDLRECRYVGLTTKTPEKRLAGHITEAFGGSQRHVYKWIRELLQEGVNPTLIVFQPDCPDEELDASERAWMAAARHEGAKLTNETEGGRDAKQEKLLKWMKDQPDGKWRVSQTFINDPDRLAYRNARIREGHARIDKTPTMCECGAGPFVGAVGVMRHTAIKHDLDQSQLWCSCGAGPFLGTHGLSIHTRNHDEQEKVFCPDCPEGPFTGIRGLASHKTHKHTEKVPTMCPICGAGPFAGTHALSGHTRQRHADAEPTWCECGAGPFVGSHGLGGHQRYCGDVELIACPDCEKGPFVGATGLASHRSHKHTDSQSPTFCECGAGPFSGKWGLGSHKPYCSLD